MLYFTYSDIEFAAIDCIIVSIESLDALISADVPHLYCFIATATRKYLREWLELD